MSQGWKVVEYLLPTPPVCVRLSRVRLTKRAANDVTEAPTSMKFVCFALFRCFIMRLTFTMTITIIIVIYNT